MASRNGISPVKKSIPGDASDPAGLTALLHRYLTWLEVHHFAENTVNCRRLRSSRFSNSLVARRSSLVLYFAYRSLVPRKTLHRPNRVTSELQANTGREPCRGPTGLQQTDAGWGRIEASGTPDETKDWWIAFGSRVGNVWCPVRDIRK